MFTPADPEILLTLSPEPSNQASTHLTLQERGKDVPSRRARRPPTLVLLHLHLLHARSDRRGQIVRYTPALPEAQYAPHARGRRGIQQHVWHPPVEPGRPRHHDPATRASTQFSARLQVAVRRVHVRLVGAQRLGPEAGTRSV